MEKMLISESGTAAATGTSFTNLPCHVELERTSGSTDMWPNEALLSHGWAASHTGNQRRSSVRTIVSARKRTMLSTVCTTVLTSLLLVVASASDAAANCQNTLTAQSIPAGTPGSTLANIMAVSTKPCTINVAPGTYTVPNGNSYTIADGITVRGTEAQPSRCCR